MKDAYYYFQAGRTAYRAGLNVFDTPDELTFEQRTSFINGWSAEEELAHHQRVAAAKRQLVLTADCPDVAPRRSISPNDHRRTGPREPNRDANRWNADGMERTAVWGLSNWQD